MTLITTWYVLSVTMKEIDSNLPNEILKSVRDIEIEKFIEEEGDALRSQLCLWHIENKKDIMVTLVLPINVWIV